MLAVITLEPSSTPVTSTVLSSIFVTVAFASVPDVNVIVSTALNGVVLTCNIIFEPSATVADSSTKEIAVASISGCSVARITPFENNEYPVHFC